MKKMFIVLAILALFVGMASAKLTDAKRASELQDPNRANTVVLLPMTWKATSARGLNGRPERRRGPALPLGHVHGLSVLVSPGGAVRLTTTRTVATATAGTTDWSFRSWT